MQMVCFVPIARMGAAGENFREMARGLLFLRTPLEIVPPLSTGRTRNPSWRDAARRSHACLFDEAKPGLTAMLMYYGYFESSRGSAVFHGGVVVDSEACPAGSHAPAWEPGLFDFVSPGSGRWSVLKHVPTLERWNVPKNRESPLKQKSSRARGLKGIKKARLGCQSRRTSSVNTWPAGLRTVRCRRT